MKSGTTVRDLAGNFDAVEAIKRRRTAERTASTWNKAVAFLHAFYEDYEVRRRRKHPQTPPVPNPVKKMRVSEDNARERWLTDDEEIRLHAELPDPVDWTLVLAAMHSGARRGEHLRTQVDDGRPVLPRPRDPPLVPERAREAPQG